MQERITTSKAEKTITSVYCIRRMEPISPVTGRYIASTLEGQLSSIGSYVKTHNNGVDERLKINLNHFAYYVCGGVNQLRGVYIITNVDYLKLQPNPVSHDNQVENIIRGTLENYQEGSKDRLRKVANIVSCDPKLSDDKLMQLCGLLPKDSE